MATKIDSVTARDKLPARREPYWHRVSKGNFLGYRKMASGPGGTWVARSLDEATRKQRYRALGDFSDKADNLRFDIAGKAAKAWFEHLDKGGSSEDVTVKKACERYIEKLEAQRKFGAVKDAKGRFERWVYPNQKLSSTPVDKLTPGQLNDWRVKLVKTPALLQDKKKLATKPRSASSVNREMAVLKAALNLALEDGYATSDFAWSSKLKPIANATGRRDCYLDADQRRLLISHLPADLGALVTGLSLIPVRPGALAKLTVAQFDKRLGVLRIGEDKSGANRGLELPPSTAAFFAEQCKGQLPSAPIFSQAATGKHWDKDAWKKPIKAAFMAANQPYDAVLYSLRHSGITDLLALHKLDTLTVARLSGTSLAMIEKHYGHLLNRHAADALSKLAL